MSDPEPRELSDMRRPGRGIAVTLIVLLLFLVAADVGLRLWAQALLGARIARTLDVPGDPSVRLGGFPFLLSVARGRFTWIDIETSGASAEGLTLDRVEVRLEGVEFSRAEVLTGRGGSMRVERGEGLVEVSERSVNDFLQEQDVPAQATLIGPRVRVSATIEVAGQELEATAVGRIELVDGAMVLEPQRVRVDGVGEVPVTAVGLRLPLPELIAGMTYERVRVREGMAVVRATLGTAEVRLGEADR